MIVSCKHCGKKLKVDLSAVKGDRAKVQCKLCGKEFIVHKQDQEEKSAPEEQSSAPEQEEQLRTKGMSLKSKLTLLIFLLMFASLSLTGLIVGYYSRTTLADQAETHLMRIAQEKSKQYKGIFSRINDEVQGVADYVKRLYSRQGVDSEIAFSVLMPWDGDGYGNSDLNSRFAEERSLMQRVGVTLDSLVSKNPFLSLGYFGSRNDLLVLDKKSVYNKLKELEAFIPTKRPWYQKAQEQGEVIWTDPYVDANSNNLVVTCAAPVFGQTNDLLGVVGFDVLLDTIQKDVLNLDIGYESYAFLVNKKGKVLVQPGMISEGQSWDSKYDTDNLLKTKNKKFNTIVLDMIKGGRTGFDSFTRDGEDKYVAYTYLPAIDAAMAIVSSKQDVMAPAVWMQNLVLAVWAGVLLITIGLSLYVGNRITRPINYLTRMANLVSQGKTDLEELPEDRKDEIGLLTRSFNRLVVSLRVAMSRKR